MIARRAELRMTQAQAATRAKCCAGTWVRWENPFRLPRPLAWLKIAQALDIPLEKLQNAAGTTLLEISGGNAKQPGWNLNEPMTPVDPEAYEFFSEEAMGFDRVIKDIDLHKLDFAGWNYHMSNWRAAIREQIRGVDYMVRSLKHQLELFIKLHHSLIGYEKGRMAPLRQKALRPNKPKKNKPKAAAKDKKKAAAAPAGKSSGKGPGRP
jgi:transcriptional regulator with XRE-family HTH domain